MRESRHPHPHIDPRQPRNGSVVGTNPPVFVWNPSNQSSSSHLEVAKDAEFKNKAYDIEGLSDPVFLPEEAMAEGQYWWRWSSGSDVGEMFQFEISPDAVLVEVPAAIIWKEKFSAEHPRLYVRPEELPALRESRNGQRKGTWAQLKKDADEILKLPHEISEPEYLPDRDIDYKAFWAVWYPTMWGSRQFVYEAQTLSLAYLASGEKTYARAACERMVSISRWDPEGSSYLDHNDEAHMSVIWHGSSAVDGVWDQFTEDELAVVIECFRRRGQITFEHMHSQGMYGVDRFDSHAGREIVFLALIAIVFNEHIPEADEWLNWLRPVLCGIWPAWATDDGGWAEGMSYSLPYVRIMTQFASALKRGTGIDLYRRPFWRNHARWRESCLPPYAEWMGFGDHSERWQTGWEANADLVELIGHESQTSEFDIWVKGLRDEIPNCLPTIPDRAMKGILPYDYLMDSGENRPSGQTEAGMLRCFEGVGWAAVRTSPEEFGKDIALIFRSSPFGAISHSHANNNDFILHVAGKVMAMPSGYYAGYGSNHHAHWVWHTKSHNCVTLSGDSQLLRSHNSAGSIDHAWEDDRLVYFRGTADASYSHRVERYRRHVLYLKRHSAFVMIDEIVSRPDVVSSLQWNIHSWNSFQVDEEKKSFLIEREGSALKGQFLFGGEGFFSLSEGWDPPPMKAFSSKDWTNQYHLSFTPNGLDSRRNFGVVLSAGHAALQMVSVTSERVGGAEVATIGDDFVAVNQGDSMTVKGLSSKALVLVVIGGVRYEITDEGISGSTDL